MTPNPSIYCPPRRSRWRARISSPLGQLRRVFRLQRFYERIDLPIGQLALSFLIPCHALAWTRFARIQNLCRCLYGVFLGVAVTFLGEWMADIAFGLMVALHATGFLALRRRLALAQGMFMTCFLTISVLIALGLWIYEPVNSALREHLWMPLRTEQGVVIVDRASLARRVRRGDLIAYRIHERRNAGGELGIHVQEGFGFERVLGMPGDRIVFSPGFFEVNGVLREARADMPVEGEWVVPAGRWFLWPSMARRGGHPRTEAITSAMMSMCFVARADFVGRPFRRWFGRLQPIPSS